MKNNLVIAPNSQWPGSVGRVILFLVCIIPGMYFSFVSLQEPWTIARIARANYSLGEDHLSNITTSLAGFREEHAGGDMMQVALLTISNWLPEAIGLLPIGTLFIAFLYYILALELTNSLLISSATTIYASWYYPLLYSQYGTQTYAWTHMLFLSFLYLLVKWIHKGSTVLSILIIIIFICTFLYYHTTPLWIIVILVVVTGCLKFINKDGSSWARSSPTWFLALFCIVFYFSFDTVVYQNGLIRFATEAVGESFFQSFYQKVVIPLFFDKDQLLEAFVIAPVNPRLATWTTLGVLLILTIPASIWVTYKIYRALHGKSIFEAVTKPEDVFIWSIIIVAAGHALIYTAYGAVSLRVIPIAFPLILPLIAKEFPNGEKWGSGLALSLAIFAILGFMSYAPTLKNAITTSETGMASKLIQPSARILADPNTYGSLFLASTTDDKWIDFSWLDSDKYSSLVGLRPINHGDFDFVILDSTDNPVASLNWRYFEPWTRNKSLIDNNPELNQVYDSEYLHVYQPAIYPLPPRISPEKLGQEKPSNVLSDSIHLVITVVIIFLFPGAVISLAALKYSPWLVNDKNSLVATGICTSISAITFIGYLSNHLSLKFFIPLIVSIHLCLFLLLLSTRPVLRNISIPTTSTITFFIVLIVWTFSATTIKDARIETRSQYTEFFATRGDDSNSLALGVITHSDQPGQFKIVIKTNKDDFEITNQFNLKPGSMYIQEMVLPEDLRASPIKIILMKDEKPYRQLAINGANGIAPGK